MRDLFGFPGEPEKKHHDNEDGNENFIEILEGKEMKIMTTRQRRRYQTLPKTIHETVSETTQDSNTEFEEQNLNSGEMQSDTCMDDQWNIMQTYSTNELLEAQESDTDLSLILFCLKSNQEPAQSDVAISSSAAKKFVINKEFFYLNDEGILYNVSKYGVRRWNEFIWTSLDLSQKLHMVTSIFW